MSKTICFFLAAGLLGRAAAAAPLEPAAKFLGANSCASSGCHGGGGSDRNQFLVWSLKDFHSQRPAATLTTARARQIAAAAGIADATTDERCTSCHAPLRSVPESLRGEHFDISEGVSCESCHGPAENWLRGHTRTDWTRADCTAAGLRDLENLYVRANTCVACHQVVSPALLQAGHPELIFELDGQSVAEPKHWRAEKNGNGAQAWFVGQAVALREMSWELARDPAPPESEVNRWRALVWLMTRVDAIDPGLPPVPDSTLRPNAENFATTQKWGDDLAQSAAKLAWTDHLTAAALLGLARTSADFTAPVPASVNARRAERLVLALDRLLAAQRHPPAKASTDLDHLFQLAQSLPDFDPKTFATTLDKFSEGIEAR